MPSTLEWMTGPDEAMKSDGEMVPIGYIGTVPQVTHGTVGFMVVILGRA